MFGGGAEVAPHLFFMRTKGYFDWEDWLYGLFAGFIGGGAGAVSSGFAVGITDPKDFNLYTGKFYLVIVLSFVFNGTISAMSYLHQRPLPARKTTLEITETQGSKVTKLEETEAKGEHNSTNSTGVAVSSRDSETHHAD